MLLKKIFFPDGTYNNDENNCVCHDNGKGENDE